MHARRFGCMYALHPCSRLLTLSFKPTHSLTRTHRLTYSGPYTYVLLSVCLSVCLSLSLPPSHARARALSLSILSDDALSYYHCYYLLRQSTTNTSTGYY